MREIVGDPAVPWEEWAQEHFAVQFQATQAMMQRDIRDRLSDTLVSYEDVADVIAECEKEGRSI